KAQTWRHVAGRIVQVAREGKRGGRVRRRRQKAIVANPVGDQQRRPYLPAILPKEIEEIGNVAHARIADQSIYRVIGLWVRTAHSGLVRSDRTEDVLRETVTLLHVNKARVAEHHFERVRDATVGELVIT